MAVVDYPTSPAWSATVAPYSRNRVNQNEGGNLELSSIAPEDVVSLTLTYPVIMSTQLETVRAWVEANADNTIRVTLPDGTTYYGYFQSRVVQFSQLGGLNYRASVRLNVSRIFALIAPYNLVLTPDSTNPLRWTLTWNEVPGATSYQLLEDNEDEDVDTGTSYTRESNGLSGVTVSIRVRPKSASGYGPWSDTLRYTYPSVPNIPPAPGVIDNVQALFVTWQAPPNTGGLEITGWKYRYKLSSASTWTTSSETTDLMVTISSLTANSEYDVQVQAANAAGASAWSATTKGTPRASGPALGSAANPIVIANPNGYDADVLSQIRDGRLVANATYFRFTVPSGAGGQWTIAIASTPTSHDWDLSEDDGTPSSTSTDGTESISVELADEAVYTFRVYRYSNAALSTTAMQLTISVATATAPDAPTLSGEAGQRQANLTWTTPDNNGAAITQYQVQYRKSGQTADMDTVRTTSTNATISDLDAVQYSFKVRAENRVGWGPYSNEIDLTILAQVSAPNAPVLTATVSVRTVTLTWTEPTNTGGAAITGYEYRHRKRGTNTWTSDTTTSRTATISGLDESTDYIFRVRAQNSAGYSGYSNTASITTGSSVTAPSAPVLSGSVSVTTVSLTWTEPSSTGGAAISQYRYRYRKTGASTWTTETTGSRFADVSGLDATTEYEFQAGAQNSAGWSAYSNTYTVSTEAVVSSPGAPVLSGTRNPNSISLTWTEPASGGAAITGYEYRYRQNSETSWTTRTTAGRSATVSGLSEGTAYRFEVRAQNTSGYSAYSNTYTVTTLAKPTSPTLSGSVSGQTVSLTWTAPSSTGGATITGYEYRYRKTGAASWTTDTTSSRSASISGLSRVTAYEFQVRATNSVGSSPYSSTYTVTTEAVAPNAPTLSGSVSGLTVNLSWNAPANNGAAITRYQYRYRKTGASSWTTDTTTSRSATISGLTKSTSYEFQLRAENSAGWSAYSNTYTATTASAPSAIAFAYSDISISSDGQSVTLTWDEPANGGSAITGYQYRYKRRFGSWTTRTTTSRTATISGLDIDESYDFALRARNAVGWSPWNIQRSIGARPQAKPVITATRTSETTASLSWTRGTRSIHTYEYRYDLGSTRLTFETTATTATVSGLVGSSPYSFYVRGRNDRGWSDWSLNGRIDRWGT